MDTKDIETSTGNVDMQNHAVALALDMPEILEEIFGYFAKYEHTDLVNSALVCRKWRDAAYHPSLWRHSKASLHLKRLDTVKLLPTLARRRIPSIDLLSVQSDMRDLLPSLPSMKSFCYKSSPVPGSSISVMTDEMLCGALQQRHTALTNFILFGCSCITDASVVLLSSRLPNLEKLGLSHCKQVTDAGLVAVARNLPRMLRLYVSHCGITDAGVAALAGRRPEVASGTPLLSTLNVSGCGITDTALLHISIGLPKMEELFVTECPRLTDAGVGHLANMGSLIIMYTIGSPGITEDGLKQLPKSRGVSIHFPHLNDNK